MERPLSISTAVQRLIAALTRMLRNPDTRALALVLGAVSVDAVLPTRSASRDDPARERTTKRRPRFK